MSDLLHYLPEFMQNYREIRKITEIEDREMSNVLEHIQSIPTESSISSATDTYGLKRYEAMLGITPKNGNTITQRREQVLRIWSGETITIRWLKQVFQQRFGGKVTITMPEAYTLALAVHGMSSIELKELEWIMQHKIPVNVAYTISGNTQTSSEGILYHGGVVANTIHYTIKEN